MRSLFLLFILIACVAMLLTKQGHKESASARIIGGEHVSWSRKYPWFVRLNKVRGASTCGGSLITRDCVLTAAHCIVWGDKVTHVRIGNTEVKKVKKTIVHPRFDQRHPATGKLIGDLNDIALIILESASKNDPVRLDFAKPTQNSEVTIIGKGATQPVMNDLKPFVPPLQEAHMRVQTNARQCPLVIGNKINSLLDFVCFVSDDQSSCYGDSGGPAIQWKNNVPYLIGITSQGVPGCLKYQNKYSVIYTSVAHHMDWIRTMVQRHARSALV